jgi:hypothetical protein
VQVGDGTSDYNIEFKARHSCSLALGPACFTGAPSAMLGRCPAPLAMLLDPGFGLTTHLFLLCLLFCVATGHARDHQRGVLAAAHQVAGQQQGPRTLSVLLCAALRFPCCMRAPLQPASRAPI